jgi:hypothetical protein
LEAKAKDLGINHRLLAHDVVQEYAERGDEHPHVRKL